MAILKEKVNLHDGDNVNAELINDTVETAISVGAQNKGAKI